MNPIDQLVAPITTLSFKVTAGVLRRIADAMDAAGSTPAPAPAQEIHYHYHLAPVPPERKIFGRRA